ncbi:MAG: AAA family ATPase [Clostridiales bacterium]|nr:AAA family ATPase [Clostridiales bacterium]
MSNYINPGDGGFRVARASFYIDKSGMIAYLNSCLGTKNRFVCATRPRRFGKTAAAHMISAYYDKSVRSDELFADLKISRDETFERHLDKYTVVYLNMKNIMNLSNSNIYEMIANITRNLKEDLNCLSDERSIAEVLDQHFKQTGMKFVFVVDGWDCLKRETPDDFAGHERCAEFLASFLADKEYLALAYMTGILPIGENSKSLKIFTQYSMTDPRELAEYFGFTETEVREACDANGLDFEVLKKWYDGYPLGGFKIYNPYSVSKATLQRTCEDYWCQKLSYHALRDLLGKDIEGLQEAATTLLAKDRVKVDISKYRNDLTKSESVDDVLTLLVHLGYLAYDAEKSEVLIPNKELEDEFLNAFHEPGWTEKMVKTDKRVD